MSQLRLSFPRFSWALSLKLALSTGLFAFVHTPQVILSQEIPQRWEATEYQPQSGIGKPRRVAGAGTRSTCKLKDQPPLTALVPENTLGVTVSNQPTFYVYVPARSPQASPLKVRFLLQDKNEKLSIYETSFLTVGKPGIVAITLPNQAGLLPLEIGQDYTWSFSVNCSTNDFSSGNTVNGVIRRVELNAKLNEQLKQASLQKKVELYAAAGLWQDSLTTLMQLKAENPNNSEVNSVWAKLMNSVGLEDMTQESLVQISTTPQN